MSFPPMLLHLRIPNGDGFIGLWLPWFLIYIILLVLTVIAIPFILVMAIFLIPAGRWRPLFLAVPYIWQVLFNMRGLKVDIEQSDRKLLVSFI